MAKYTFQVIRYFEVTVTANSKEEAIQKWHDAEEDNEEFLENKILKSTIKKED